MNRNKAIIKASIIGVIANLFLTIFKVIVGVITNSIAIILDGVHNLSDTLSSIVTIIGTKLASKQPDKKHPYGYGRVEYLSASIISVLILYAGVTALVESIKEIIVPSQPDYSVRSLIIIVIAVLVKIVLGRYAQHVGKKYNSKSLIASGKDAFFDSIISVSTLMAAGIYLAWNISLEAWLGVIISFVIIRSGFEMIKEALSPILGERVDITKAKGIKETILSFEQVEGVYDLILHNYGPNYMIGSVHIEVSDKMTLDKLDKLEREITQKVFNDHKVNMAGISVYAKNDENSMAQKIQKEIKKIVMSKKDILQMHGFYLNEEAKIIYFDVVIDFKATNSEGEYKNLEKEIQRIYPDYKIEITVDLDICD